MKKKRKKKGMDHLKDALLFVYLQSTLLWRLDVCSTISHRQK